MTHLNQTLFKAAIAKDICSGYEYDEKGRVPLKSTPQNGTIRYVYDRRGRLVLSQDENQFTTILAGGLKQWSFNVYANHNRVVSTGLNEEGRIIQRQSSNIKDGTDIVTHSLTLQERL